MRKKLAALLLCGGMVAGMSVTALAVEYPDVHEGEWFYPYVMDVGEKKLMTGYDNGSFGAYDNLTRGQFATILWRMSGAPSVGYDGRYPDVPSDIFYAEASKWASENGIITGYSDGRLGGNDNITREQVATILKRYAPRVGKDDSAKGDIYTYPDAGYVSEFALEGMEYAVGAELIKGDNEHLNPQGNVNRAVAATLISRFDEYRQPPKPKTENSEQWEGTVSRNQSRNNYYVWGNVVQSYLNENPDGTFTRVESYGEKIIVEMYSVSGKKIDSREIPMELNRFGGFYSGGDANYFVFGQNNDEQNDGKEIMRVVKYSKDFRRLGMVSVNGANTTSPFQAGSLRMTETKGKLYIHTCHQMYTSEDGLRHQANMTYVIDENTMSPQDTYGIVAGYVSHSFNQFVRTDGQYVYRVDHGDAYPRGISITKYGIEVEEANSKIPVEIAGDIGNNYTGVSVGGFELSSAGCLIAGNSIDFSQEQSNYLGQRNIFLSITDKEMNDSKMVWLTNYKETENLEVRTPQLVKIRDNQFLVMWEEYDVDRGEKWVKLVTVDADGNKTSGVTKKIMELSDCQPILCRDGLVRWYVTQDSAPVCYTINPTDLK